MGCHRRTAYRRFKALEDRLGRPVLVAREMPGSLRQVLAVRRSDLERALRMAGLDAENQDIAEIKETMDAVLVALERLIREVMKLKRP